MRVSKVLRAILGLGREVVIMSVEVETRVGTAASPGTFEGAQADILGTGDQRRTDASNGSCMEAVQRLSTSGSLVRQTRG